jgi:hypothetical protein
LEVDSFVPCLDREVCVVEEVATLVRGAIYIVEFPRYCESLDGEAEVLGIV